MSIFLPATASPDFITRYGPALTMLAELLPEHLDCVAIHHGPAFDPDTEATAGVELFPTCTDDPGMWVLIQDPAVVPALIGEPDPDGADWLVTKVTDRSARFDTQRAADPDSAALLAASFLSGNTFTLPTVAGAR